MIAPDLAQKLHQHRRMPDPLQSKELVFVYGTLRKGGSNAFRMDGAEYVGKAKAEGSLHIITWYPGFTPGSGLGWVVGEVFQVGPEQMLALDEFEGVSAGEMEGSEYRRIKVPVVIEGSAAGEEQMAWAYEWKGPVDETKRIPSGDWLEVDPAA